MTNVVDAYLVYQFLKRLTTPFKETKAYELGIIDDKGVVLKKQNELLTQEERDAWGYFDLLVNNMKKILAHVPGGSSKLGLYAASALLFKEHKNLEKMSEEEIERVLREEIANNVGDGKVAGLGVGPSGEPPKTKLSVILKRRKYVDSKIPS